MPSEREKMLAGEPYDPTDPELAAARERARELTREFNHAPAGAHERRAELLEELFASAGDCWIEPPLRCDYGFNVHAPEGLYANFGCVFLDVCRIEFGPDCMLGPGVHLYTATHPLAAAERNAGLESGAPITVGEGAWIGGQAILTAGVDVGDRAVVGAGAVVTEDVPADTVVAGNPARVVRELDPPDGE